MNNQAFIKGNVGQDPVLRQTQSGVKVATYSVGVNRPQKDKENAVTDWFNVVAWAEQAELVVANLKKGTKVIVSGRFQTRNYDDKDGKKVYVTELMQDDFGIVPIKEKIDTGSTFDTSDLPF